MKMVSIASALIAVSLAGAVSAKGLDTLVEVGKSQEEIAQVIALETKNYNNVKDALLEGEIKPGMAASDVSDKYGEPVVIIPDDAMLKWIYKPGGADYSTKNKIYLIVGKDDGLIKEIKAPEAGS